MKFSIGGFLEGATRATIGQIQGRLQAEQEIERRRQQAMERETQYDTFIAQNILPNLDKGSDDYARTVGLLNRRALGRSQGQLASEYVQPGARGPFGGFQTVGQPTQTGYLQQPPQAPAPTPVAGGFPFALPTEAGLPPGTKGPPAPSLGPSVAQPVPPGARVIPGRLIQPPAPTAGVTPQQAALAGTQALGIGLQTAVPGAVPSPAPTPQPAPARSFGRVPERAVPPAGTPTRQPVTPAAPPPGTVELPGVGRVTLTTGGVSKEAIADLRKRYAAAQAARVKGRFSDTIRTGLATVEGGVNLNPKTQEEYVRSETALRQMEGLLQGTNAPAVSLANDPRERFKSTFTQTILAIKDLPPKEQVGTLNWLREQAKLNGYPASMVPGTVRRDLTAEQVQTGIDRDLDRAERRQQHAERMAADKRAQDALEQDRKINRQFKREGLDLERIRTHAGKKKGIRTESENAAYVAKQAELKALTDEYNDYQKSWNLRLRAGETEDESIRGGRQILADINAKKREMRAIVDIWRVREEEQAAAGASAPPGTPGARVTVKQKGGGRDSRSTADIQRRIRELKAKQGR